MRTALALMCLLFSGGAAAQTAPAAQQKPSKIEDIFNARKVKSPFMALIGSAGGVAVAAADEEAAFDPHSEDTDKVAFINGMSLKGILRDKSSAYALLQHAESRTGYYLRGGRLYDFQGHAIQGVRGSVNAVQMTVVLEASGEKTTLRLGEDKDKEEDGPASGSGSAGGKS